MLYYSVAIHKTIVAVAVNIQRADPGGVGDGSRGDSLSLEPETVGLQSHCAVPQILPTVQTPVQLQRWENRFRLTMLILYIYSTKFPECEA